MAQIRTKTFDTVRVFDTTNTAGQTGRSPQDASKSYRVTDQAEFPLQDETNVQQTRNPKGITLFSKKYRFNQVSQENTTDTLANRDGFDLKRSDPDLAP